MCKFLSFFKKKMKENEYKEENIIDILNKILVLQYFYNPFEKYGRLTSTYSGLKQYRFEISISAKNFIALSPIKIIDYDIYSSIPDKVYVDSNEYKNYFERGFKPALKKVIDKILLDLDSLEQYQVSYIDELYKSGILMIYETILNKEIDNKENQKVITELLKELSDDINDEIEAKSNRSNNSLKEELEYIKKHKQYRKEVIPIKS